MKSTKRSRAGIARTETIEKLFRLFIQPILQSFIVPPGSTDNVLHRKMELYFDKTNRDIWLCRAKYPFTIKGPQWLTPSTPDRLHVDGTGNRNVPKGGYLWVRLDAKRPDIVDVEYLDQVFAVRSSDWQVFSSKCEYLL